MTKKKAYIWLFCSFGLLIGALFYSNFGLEVASEPEAVQDVYTSTSYFGNSHHDRDKPPAHITYEFQIEKMGGQTVYRVMLCRYQQENNDNACLELLTHVRSKDSVLTCVSLPDSIPSQFEQEEIKKMLSSALFRGKARYSIWENYVPTEEDFYEYVVIPQILTYLIDQQSESNLSPSSP